LKIARQNVNKVTSPFPFCLDELHFSHQTLAGTNVEEKLAETIQKKTRNKERMNIKQTRMRFPLSLALKTPTKCN
jgi:hypothetical protein